MEQDNFFEETKEINANDEIENFNAEENPTEKQENNLINSDEDNILSKLDEEGNKIGDIINNDELNIMNKYSEYSDEKLKELLEEKNNSLLKLYQEKEDSKKKLNEIIKNLNDLIAQNEEILYKGEEDEQSIEQLERILKIRTKDLELAKNTNSSYQKQYKAVQKKEKEKLANERLNAIELKIDKIRKENLKYKTDIIELKKENTTQSKKLEFSSNQKTQDNIKSYTDEIQHLSNKKHEYHLKLIMNQKSLDNILKELNNLENMSNAYIKEESDATQAQKIIEWIDLIKTDLSGSSEEIWQRVDSGESKVLQAYNDERQKIKEKETKIKEKETKIILPKINAEGANNYSSNSIKIKNVSNSSGKKPIKSSSVLRSQTRGKPENVAKSTIILGKNNAKTRLPGSSEIRKDPFKGIFSKYTYLQKAYPNLVKNSTILSSSKSKETNKEENVDNLDAEQCLKNDYANTTSEDYKNLLEKIKEYEKTNERLEKNIKDYEKMSERKLKDIGNTILFNSQKLIELQQENDLISSEIGNLEKIYELTLEQNKIKKEIKLTERKNKKMQQQQQQHNLDPSVTSNDILQQLNSGEESKKKSNQGSPLNSNFEANEQSAMEMDGKNIKFPDISNVEKIEDDVINDREKRLREIKEKYKNEEQEEVDANLENAIGADIGTDLNNISN